MSLPRSINLHGTDGERQGSWQEVQRVTVLTVNAWGRSHYHSTLQHAWLLLGYVFLLLSTCVTPSASTLLCDKVLV